MNFKRTHPTHNRMFEGWQEDQRDKSGVGEPSHLVISCLLNQL